MSILTDNLWPKDIPESDRLIALLGMVQIMEDDVDKSLSAFEQVELSERVVKQEAEIERLNGLVAMKAEALKMASDFKLNDIVHGYINSAISASSDTVSAYKREVQAEALEKAAGWPWTGIMFLDDRSFVKDELNHAASELRAKGE